MTGQVLSRTRIPLHRNGIGTPVAMILGSCLSLQFGAALAVSLFPIAGVLGTTTLRLAFAALILVVAIRPRVGGWTTAQWRAAGAYGVALAAMNTAFYAAIDRIPLGTAVAIEFLGPLGLAAILSRRRLDLVWVAVALCGMGILGAESLFGLAHLDPVGVAFACIAGLCWAGYILTSARLGAAVPGHGGLAVGLVIAALAVAPMGVRGAAVALSDATTVALAVGTAVLASVIPYCLELSALRRLPRHVFGVLLSLEPIVATFAGWVMLHQSVGPLRLAAITLVIIASIGTTITAARPPRAGAPSQA